VISPLKSHLYMLCNFTSFIKSQQKNKGIPCKLKTNCVLKIKWLTLKTRLKKSKESNLCARRRSVHWQDKNGFRREFIAQLFSHLRSQSAKAVAWIAQNVKSLRTKQEPQNTEQRRNSPADCRISPRKSEVGLQYHFVSRGFAKRFLQD
jgi:hypothetical protein